MMGHTFSASFTLRYSWKQPLHNICPQPSTVIISPGWNCSVQIRQLVKSGFGLHFLMMDVTVSLSCSISPASQRTTRRRKSLTPLKLLLGMWAGMGGREVTLAYAARISLLKACCNPIVARSNAESSGASLRLNADAPAVPRTMDVESALSSRCRASPSKMTCTSEEPSINLLQNEIGGVRTAGSGQVEKSNGMHTHSVSV